MKATLITLTNEAMFKTDLKRCVYNKETKEFYIVSEEGITVFYNGKSFDVEMKTKLKFILFKSVYIAH